MANGTDRDWVSVLERHGVPLAILAVIMFGMWRTAGWIAPKLDRAFQEHTELVKSLDRELSEQGRSLRAIQRDQSTTADVLERINATLEAQNEAIRAAAPPTGD